MELQHVTCELEVDLKPGSMEQIMLRPLRGSLLTLRDCSSITSSNEVSIHVAISELISDQRPTFGRNVGRKNKGSTVHKGKPNIVTEDLDFFECSTISISFQLPPLNYVP